MGLGEQIVWLLVLAVPVASVTWTVTHEEILREPRAYFQRRAEHGRSLWERKLFYPLICEYCFSHYVAAAMLAVSRFTLLYVDWRGYLIAWLSLVWESNIYMGLYGMVGLEVKKERVEIKQIEHEVEDKKAA